MGKRIPNHSYSHWFIVHTCAGEFQYVITSPEECISHLGLSSNTINQNVMKGTEFVKE